ncbi:bifunctional acetate--CoA ligase family protein/GNAT family N-acetyltransferase [Vibrio spartinae]|uniref:Succinyl-CoA synthetase subunit alpha n=1 Tax=Vibrio spartinae TaxID=1918945 RepID=A0A1N6MAJ3_9VIBR|nr:bifunctional acetate--CoA ligase family protein/GNAT family N-acetyltransferase [Vibrio spartinae]QMV16599.1 succinyl-CoA synthetase subunit alpha [Vibrio spartinae]SIO96423.1 succinyl-CoA synthetase subunit alpha [Vibrio spartinae]
MNNLSHFLKPRSVAVIGASNRPLRAGHVVMKNLLSGNFDGTVMPVTPRYTSVCGVLAYQTIDSLPIIPDIAVLCTHASRNISLFHQLAEKKVAYVVVLSSDMYSNDPENHQIQQQCLAIAKAANMRIVGPNSLGIILPWISFNASFSPVPALKGNIAFISQSAAVCTTILDWANEKQIGFSAFISLGNASDIDFNDLLDHLSTDRHTDAILLYIDTIRNARRFISAARAASRNRRILVLKGGRTLEGRKAAKAHTGGIDTLDIIYDSAIRRSGMLRVHNTHELFAAVETLTHPLPLRGERLAIITNGGGPAIMAIDTLLERGGKLARLDDDIMHELDQCLPPSWSHANPIDLVGDAGHQRYVSALNAVLDSDVADAILIMHCPSAVAESEQTAQAVIDALNQHPRSRQFNILTNWSGELTAKAARQRFYQAGIPTYRTPESAVTAFMHMVEYKRNQKQLMETPTTADFLPPEKIHKAQQWIQEHLHLANQQATLLDTHQIGDLLTCFEFDVLPTWMAQDSSEAVHIAETIGYPVAVKLRSPDIAHKSDVQGVMLNLRNRHEVESASQAILDRVSLSYPAALIHGLVVQGMAKLAGGEELRIKVKHDETFGPVILLGQGGSEWQEATDAEAALPPLNMTLARYLIVQAIKNNKIRLQKLPVPIDIAGLSQFLVRLSQLIETCPEVHELDIHPLLVNGHQFTILDADLHLKPYHGDAQQRLAIRPYPSEMEAQVVMKNQESILIRPILPEDEPDHADFINKVSKEDLYKRFFTEVGTFNHEALANMTQIDYDREMAFVAVRSSPEHEIIGVSRALISPDNSDAEFAILIRSDLKGLGLGRILMRKIIDYCTNKGTQQISGITMPSNQGMLSLAQKLGFHVEVDFEDGTAEMQLLLSQTSE